ncbi:MULTISPECIES: SGNH/GDSL hydrolase family protein [Nocardiopsis]|uniref:G-D-S-L family lipolytic protein n=1 Tax=Nocardiopsis sinuspersici TaxID=501010 RepID=A0A1V3C870_9ACTN|nr:MULTISPECIES: SGNH/GDSL hydrolase family protein [Nocardiopsis]NYH53531.1 lysophospholipase L1-like esterase [Nocardiopsis sinuspersici]OOC56848.1 G-D-S-L family lipolytic protein [Nocardiopsis sinuspersici]
MLRAARARRIAAATAFGGGGLTLVGGGTVALLYLQARMARRAVGSPPWDRPVVDGVYGDGGGPPIRMLMMGDSTAAGFAVELATETPGVLLATGLAAAAERPVRLLCTASPGATSAHLAAQVERARALEEGHRHDLAVVFIGANDVIRRVRPGDAVAQLRETVRGLVGHGTAVVVATCPDLGTVRPLGWPLRSMARRASRQLAAAQTIAVTEVGGRTVSMSDLLSDDFRSDPVSMFGPDRFHPSALGYSQAAFAVLPSACAALGLLPELDEAERTSGILPVDRAAVVAAETPGTEVSRAGAHVSGHTRGRRGRWAALVRGPFRARGGQEGLEGTGAPGTADRSGESG